MGDPLSVAASVVGLLSASAAMISTLYNLASTIKEAPQLANSTASELADITTILQGIQKYLTGKARASPQRLSYITVEQVTATLTGCVLTYSDLDSLLKSLHANSGMRMWDRGLWYLKQDTVNSIVQRLQNHKVSLGLMLNILQCESMQEAETSMDRLCDLVNEVLRSNQKLSMRLRNIEYVYQRTATSQAVAGDGTDDTMSDSESSTRLGRDAERMSFAASQAFFPAPASATEAIADLATTKLSTFEEQLHKSRVYRHAQSSDLNSSLINDARSTLAISICSSLTLGQVSNVSVYAIPVYASELSNASLYDFRSVNEHEAPGGPHLPTHTPSTSTILPKKNVWRRILKSREHKRLSEATDDVVPAAPSGVFGVPLQQSIRYANVAITYNNQDGSSYVYGYIPIVLGKCGLFLKEEATKVEFIFELSGSPKRVQILQTLFDTPNRYGKDLNWSDGYTAHDVANVLLRYFRQLPEPLIPLQLYERFREPLRGGPEVLVTPETGHNHSLQTPVDQNAAVETYQHLIKELPAWNQQSLTYLLDLLEIFAYYSDSNKMTAWKLAALFQPSVLDHPDHRLVSSEQRLSQNVVVFMLENPQSFTDPLDTSAISVPSPEKKTNMESDPSVEANSSTPPDAERQILWARKRSKSI